MKGSRDMKLKTALLSVMLVMMTAGQVVLAENEGKTNIKVSQESVSFDQYLVMDELANVPNETCIYSITGGKSVGATDDTPQIFSGVDAKKITISVDQFKPYDKTWNVKVSGDSVNLEEGQKYARNVVTADLSEVVFKEPGIYRYLITEETPREQGISIVGGDTRILDVYVESDDNVKLKITGNVLHGSEKEIGSVEEETRFISKDKGFTNIYSTSNLFLEKVVTGNQGNRNKYFEFKLNISNAEVGTVYIVDLSNAESSVKINGRSKRNSSELTVGLDGSVETTFYLKNKQSIKICGITAETMYNISEAIEDEDGYEVSYEIQSKDFSGKDEVDGISTGDTVIGDKEDIVIFTNYKNGVVPTGLFDKATIYVILAVFGGILILVELSGRKYKKDKQRGNEYEKTGL